MKTFTKGMSAALLGAMLATGAQAADTLNVWARYGESEEAVLGKIVEAFTAKTGIEVELFVASTDFDTRVVRAAAGGNLPDVIINDATFMGQLLEMGALKEIDRASLVGADELHDVAWQSMRAPDGKYYGVPTSAQAFAVFVRKDWREKLGYALPANWEELFALAKAFTEDDPDGNGVADTYGYVMPLSNTRGYTTWFLSDLIWQAGGDFLAAKGDGYVSSLGTPEVATAVAFARSFICEGYAQPNAITSTTGDATPVFTSGQGGIYRTGPYHIASFYSELTPDVLEVIVPPAGPAGQGSLAEGEAAYITSTSGQAEAAQQFIEFLVSQEGQKMGMAVDMGTNPIVRLSVNKNVDTLTERKDDSWGTYAEQFASDGHYFPRVPNWQPIRLIAADGFNAILADCDSDIAAGLASMDETVNAELDRQGVLAD